MNPHREAGTIDATDEPPVEPDADGSAPGPSAPDRWRSNTASLAAGPPSAPLHRQAVVLFLLLLGIGSVLSGVSGVLTVAGEGRGLADQWYGFGPFGLGFGGLLWTLAGVPLGVASVEAARRFIVADAWRETVGCLVLWAVVSLVVADGPIEARLGSALLFLVAAGSIAYDGLHRVTPHRRLSSVVDGAE
jgi:hypothetical protein